MNNNLWEYVENFDNTILLYADIISDNILENKKLKNIDDDSKKALFDYIFDKYLDNEIQLNSLSITSRYYGWTLKDIKIFSSIQEYCKDKIKKKIEELKISDVRDIFMHLDMVLFLDEKNLITEIPFSEYISLIKDGIKILDYSNLFYYSKSISLIFLMKFKILKIKKKRDIDEILLEVIKKIDEYKQYNIFEDIIYSLSKDEIKSDFIYDNLIKYCIELFSKDKLKNSHLKLNLLKTLEVIIDAISEDIERLKYILDMYLTKDEKELEEIYKHIDYNKYRYKLDIPIYCLYRLNNRVNLKNDVLSIEQYDLIIKYFGLNVKKENEIIIKTILDEDIDLSVYWDLVRKEFIEYCSNYDKKHWLFFLDRYRDLLKVLNPTKEEFKKFSEHSKIYFYYYILKEENKELYPLIPEEIKRELEMDKKYNRKIEEENKLFQIERVECVHKFFDKNKIIEDIDNIIKVLGDNPTFEDLNSYNKEFCKGKYENKEKYLESEIVIISPFIIDYFLIISRMLVKDMSMDKIKNYVNNYWDKHWGIQLYNYLKRQNDVVDKVNFNEEEKIKIKDYFKSSNYSKTIKNLHNCLEGTFDNSYLYFTFFNLENIFKDIQFEYDEEILINMLKIPYYYYKGDIKLYKNNYYLEYFGIIVEYDNINFDNFFGNKEMKTSVLQKLIDSCYKDKITDEFGSYYTLLSIIKLYNSDKENYKLYYNDIAILVVNFYKLSLNNVEFSQIYNIINNFIDENNLDNEILHIISKSNKLNHDHLKYINNLQRKLLEEKRFYKFTCYKLIYEIRKKINSKDIKIIHNVNPSAIEKIKYELGQLCKNINFDDINQEEFNKLKNQIKNISDIFINDTDFNFEERIHYENSLYLQSFIIEDIEIWKNFTGFLIKNKNYYYMDMVIEKLIFENLFEEINNKNNFNFNLFIDKLVLLYNSIVIKITKSESIPNENFILCFLNRIILTLVNLSLKQEDLYKKIYNSIPFLDENIKHIIEKNIFNDFPPVKIIIRNNNYMVYNLENKLKFETDDIDNLVERLIPGDFNNITRILYFKYLLDDINNNSLTLSHPYNFEDTNEGKYELSNKVYIVCFSNTIDKKNSYAWWKVYGNTSNYSLDKIKVRILINKKDLLKNILLKKDKNFEYYFGDMYYKKDKKPNTINKNIKDFFEKSKDFEFENEFRVLVKCIGIDKIPDDKYKIFLKLDIDNRLYKNIKLENELSFNPYINLENKHKDAIKYLLKESQDKI